MLTWCLALIYSHWILIIIQVLHQCFYLVRFVGAAIWLVTFQYLQGKMRWCQKWAAILVWLTVNSVLTQELWADQTVLNDFIIPEGSLPVSGFFLPLYNPIMEAMFYSLLTVSFAFYEISSSAILSNHLCDAKRSFVLVFFCSKLVRYTCVTVSLKIQFIV